MIDNNEYSAFECYAYYRKQPFYYKTSWDVNHSIIHGNSFFPIAYFTFYWNSQEVQYTGRNPTCNFKHKEKISLDKIFDDNFNRQIIRI